MMNTTRRAELRAIAEAFFHGIHGCHGLDHTLRVVDNALCLAQHYPTADADLLEAAAWLHDIGRGVEREAGVSHAILSAQLAEERLPALGFSPEETQIICTAIADHRYSSGRTPSSMEGKLLQDADRLDALGAIGIARTFTNGSDRDLYHANDPFARQRPPNDNRYNLDHFFIKLLRLPETMHTPEARAQGELRVQFMRDFLNHFAAEVGVEA